MTLTPKLRKIRWVLLAGVACGAVVWGLSVPLTGMREPFDSPSHYYLVATFIAGAVAALPTPRYWWAAPIGVFIGERLYAFVMLPETRNWLLFGIVMGLLMLTWLPAALGALAVYIASRVLAWKRRGRT